MLTPETIANKTFRRTLLGYDLEQVDDFLDEIILHLQQLERERKEMCDTIEYLAGELRRLNPDNGHETEMEEIAVPLSPHTEVVSQPSPEKPVKVKEKKTKVAKTGEGKKKSDREEKGGKVKKTMKPRKPEKSEKMELPEETEQTEKLETPLPVKLTESQEETKRFRLSTDSEASVEKASVIEVPTAEEIIVEVPVVKEIAGEEPVTEAPEAMETVEQQEPESPAQEHTAQEEMEQPEQRELTEQAGEKAHE